MIIINYAIFRSEPIYTLNDLAQIGSHNKREKKAYNSNPNIKLELSKDNIEIVPLQEKYVKGFHSLVKDYEKEHNERMKTEREDRKKTFNQMLNKSRNVVADELLFTATHQFFDNMSKEDIRKWADTCMEFVYEDLELNEKTQIGMVKNGIDFLGYRHILSGSGKIIIKLRYSSKKRLKKHLKTVSKLYNKGIVDDEYVYQRKNSFYNHIKGTNESTKLKIDTFPFK